jgi:hypothetical protein
MDYTGKYSVGSSSETNLEKVHQIEVLLIVWLAERCNSN